MSTNDKPASEAPTPPAAARGIDWRHILRALKHRNYALFFAGQGVSQIGTWMQHAAQLWLVYRLTGRKDAVGELAFFSQLPSFLLFPLAGVLGDRWNRRTMVTILQSLAALQALILAAVVYLGIVQFWHIVLLGMVAGIIRSFEIPIRQSFVVEMLEDRKDLPGAIALNSFLMNASFVIGPSLAGLAIYFWKDHGNEAPCFLINAISFGAVIAALLAMKMKPNARVPIRGSPVQSFLEGLKYTAAHKSIRGAILYLGFTALVAVQYTTLMPVFAKDVLHGDERTQGWLLSAAGLGAMMGALFIASQRSPAGLHRLMTAGGVVFGVGLVAFSQSTVVGGWLMSLAGGTGAGQWLAAHLAGLGVHLSWQAVSLWVSVATLVFLGVGRMVQMASTNTYVQMLVDDDKRSRVMAFHSLAFMGVAPIGALMMGKLAQTRLDAPGTLLLSGLACLAGAIAFAGRIPKVYRSAATGAKSAQTP
jgi:MFS family permease